MPTVSAVPALIDALVTQADAALSVTVHDGYGVTDDPGDFLMIGVEDPDIEGAAFSADTEQSWATVGSGATTEESGEITCAALSWNGDTGTAAQKAARDAAYATADAVADLCAATPSLGVSTLLWTRFGNRVQLMQNQSDAGSLALVVFRVHFRARL